MTNKFQCEWQEESWTDLQKKDRAVVIEKLGDGLAAGVVLSEHNLSLRRDSKAKQTADNHSHAS